MKKILAILTIGTLIISCGESIEQKATHHLDNAKQAFSMGNYNVAKQEIDSIRILYPKAFEARKQGIRLMQQIEETEQMHIIEYEDSMIAVTQAAFDRIKHSCPGGRTWPHDTHIILSRQFIHTS